MQNRERNDRFKGLEEYYEGYNVFDPNGERIGRVDDLFVDENDRPEYIGVKIGPLGTSSTLIPIEIARIDEQRHRIEVSADKATAKNGPAFDDDRDITPEYENEVRGYYGLSVTTTTGASEQRGVYGGYYSDEERRNGEREDEEVGKEVGLGTREGGTKPGEFRGHSEGNEGVNRSHGSDLEDELRVRRSEEELIAGTREREAGKLNVRKRVRTERERIEVPTRREEVSVERVPVNDGREAPEAEIGEDEISMPVVEEEAVVGKKAVVKEEIRVRKDVVEDTKIVEEDVRKEEVEVDDETTGRGGRPGGTAGRNYNDDELEDETRRRDR